MVMKKEKARKQAKMIELVTSPRLPKKENVRHSLGHEKKDEKANHARADLSKTFGAAKNGASNDLGPVAKLDVIGGKGSITRHLGALAGAAGAVAVDVGRMRASSLHLSTQAGDAGTRARGGTLGKTKTGGTLGARWDLGGSRGGGGGRGGSRRGGRSRGGSGGRGSIASQLRNLGVQGGIDPGFFGVRNDTNDSIIKSREHGAKVDEVRHKLLVGAEFFPNLFEDLAFVFLGLAFSEFLEDGSSIAFQVSGYVLGNDKLALGITHGLRSIGRRTFR